MRPVRCWFGHRWYYGPTRVYCDRCGERHPYFPAPAGPDLGTGDGERTGRG